MKLFVPIILLWFTTHAAFGQLVLRNDFIIDRKAKKLHNKGITYITVNLGSRTMWNLNAYGQPVKGVTVDMEALRGKKELTYKETVERMYQPTAVYTRAYIPIPLFLLLEPPMRIRMPVYGYDGSGAQ